DVGGRVGQVVREVRPGAGREVEPADQPAGGAAVGHGGVQVVAVGGDVGPGEGAGPAEGGQQRLRGRVVALDRPEPGRQGEQTADRVVHLVAGVCDRQRQAGGGGVDVDAGLG